MNQESPDTQARFRKGRGTRDQIDNICWMIERARELKKKKSTSASSTILKLLTVWITTNCGIVLKRWEYQTTLPASWETCMQDKQQQLELDMEHTLVPNWERSMSKLYVCHPAYLTLTECIMWNAGLDDSESGIKIAGENINNIRYADDSILFFFIYFFHFFSNYFY